MKHPTSIILKSSLLTFHWSLYLLYRFSYRFCGTRGRWKYYSEINHSF